MNITLDRLKYFLEVAKLEHVGLASKSLGISPSAISNAIAAIEDEYGCSLFERSNQRIYLNDKGLWLKEELLPIIQQLESLPQKIHGKASNFKGLLSVGGSFFLTNHFLQPVLQEIQKQNSNLSVEISPLRSAEVVQEVLNGIIDYGLCISPSGHPDLERQILYKGTLKIVVAKNHPLIKEVQRSNFKLSSLNKYPAAIHKFSPGIDYRETSAFNKIGVIPDIKHFYHSEDLLMKSLLASDIWAVVPDIVLDQYQSKLFQIPLPNNWSAPFEICSIYKKSMKGREIYSLLDMLISKRF